MSTNDQMPPLPVRTWQERTGNHNWREHSSKKHALAEIADLRTHAADQAKRIAELEAALELEQKRCKNLALDMAKAVTVGYEKGWDSGLEKAALVCDAVNNHDNPMTARDCSDAIRALKGQPSALAARQPVEAEPVLVPNWAGEFTSHQDWVNRAQRALSVPSHKPPAVCIDAKGRRCFIGADMARARDEGAFPVRYFWDCTAAPPPSTVKGEEPVAWRYRGTNGDWYLTDAPRWISQCDTEIQPLYLGDRLCSHAKATDAVDAAIDAVCDNDLPAAAALLKTARALLSQQGEQAGHQEKQQKGEG